MDARVGDLPSGDVHVRNGVIVAVGPSLNVPGVEVIDARDRIVLPGFVDTHWHLWSTALRMVIRAAYEDSRPSDFLKDKANVPEVVLPFTVGGTDKAKDLFGLFDDTLARLLAVAGTGRVRHVEWPPEKKAIDIGSFYSDSSLIASVLGWAPSVDLTDGLTRTVAYYRAHRAHYV